LLNAPLARAEYSGGILTENRANRPPPRRFNPPFTRPRPIPN